jgi:hypothetical protein
MRLTSPTARPKATLNDPSISGAKGYIYIQGPAFDVYVWGCILNIPVSMLISGLYW